MTFKLILKILNWFIAIVVVLSVLGVLYRITIFSPKTVEKPLETVQIEYLIDELDSLNEEIRVLRDEAKHQRFVTNGLQEQITDLYLEDHPIF